MKGYTYIDHLTRPKRAWNCLEDNIVLNTSKRWTNVRQKPLQDVNSFFWPNRMLSDSVIASLPRGGFYYKLGFRCIMYKLSSRYVLWVTDQVFYHWFMAALWSALTVNQWGKWESVMLNMDWEYEASNFFLSQRLIGMWEREHVREVYWNMASNNHQCMCLPGDVIHIINNYW